MSSLVMRNLWRTCHAVELGTGPRAGQPNNEGTAALRKEDTQSVCVLGREVYPPTQSRSSNNGAHPKLNPRSPPPPKKSTPRRGARMVARPPWPHFPRFQIEGDLGYNILE
jgi:hypothetical protein